jgi:hypothetical protein
MLYHVIGSNTPNFGSWHRKSASQLNTAKCMYGNKFLKTGYICFILFKKEKKRKIIYTKKVIS